MVLLGKKENTNVNFTGIKEVLYNPWQVEGFFRNRFKPV